MYDNEPLFVCDYCRQAVTDWDYDFNMCKECKEYQDELEDEDISD